MLIPHAMEDFLGRAGFQGKTHRLIKTPLLPADLPIYMQVKQARERDEC
jgi:hypothetical protein